jgi:hypothetical protein
MTLRFRYDPTDPEVIDPEPILPPEETIEQRRKRRRAEFEKLPPDQRPAYAHDADRWRRILAAVVNTPRSMGDIHRVVRLPGEPNTLAKFRTMGKVNSMARSGHLVWLPDRHYQATASGLQALADGAPPPGASDATDEPRAA